MLSGKAILCYICIWSHGSLQVHSLVGGLDSGRTGWSGLPMLFLQWVAISLYSSSPSTNSPSRFPELSLMGGSKHPHLHWSVAGWTSQGTGIVGSCQQVRLDHSNSVGVGVCRWDCPQLTPPSVSVPFFVPVLPLNRNISGLKTLRWVGVPIPPPRGCAYLQEVVSTGSISPFSDHFC